MFRSEEMKFLQLCIPREFAIQILLELGKTESLQFVDASPKKPGFKRDFSNFIQRCEDLLIKIKIIEDISFSFNSEFANRSMFDDSGIEILTEKANFHNLSVSNFSQLESETNEAYSNLNNHFNNYKKLLDKRKYFMENKQVLGKVEQIYCQMNKFDMNQDSDIKFQYIVGSIKIIDIERLERMVFRISKGNIIIHTEYFDGKLKDMNDRKFLALMFPGGILDTMRKKLEKLCDSFYVNRFSFPNNKNHLNLMQEDINKKLEESNNLKTMTRKEILNSLNIYSMENILEVKNKVLGYKKVYEILNLFSGEGAVLRGNFFISTNKLDEISELLLTISKENPNIAQSTIEVHEYSDKKPTLINQNEFSSLFQKIVNTYGIPRYQEINPGIFYIITFPFLFGIMFGDIGHGLLLLIFSLFLFHTNDSTFENLKKAKYLLFLMAIFSLYCGIIYNDFMGLPLNMFSSCYTSENIKKYDECVYSFGLDPIWGVSKNELQFTNSYKMKLAIIFGVCHMFFGVTLKILNGIHNSNYVEIFLESIPQMIFLTCSFGYLAFLIIMKWTHENVFTGIIQVFLEFFLEAGHNSQNAVFSGQNYLQIWLFILCIISVVTMLFLKPFFELQIMGILIKKGNTVQRNSGLGIDEGEDKPLIDIGQRESQVLRVNENHELQKILIEERDKDELHSEHQKPFDLIIYQFIETIEFVLGSVSHTASYLRLWALSLAHSQLSRVFLNNLILKFVIKGDSIGLICGFFIFIHTTIGVLMCMDSLECFLHALRLHWVEFQSKFFKGDGIEFKPLRLKESDDDKNEIRNFRF